MKQRGVLKACCAIPVWLGTLIIMKVMRKAMMTNMRMRDTRVRGAKAWRADA